MKIDAEEMKKYEDDDDGLPEEEADDMPAGCVGKSTNVKTVTKGKVKTITTTTTYKYKDG